MDKIQSLINKGKASVEDYKNVGITGVDKNNLLYVNTNLKNKNFTTIDQIQDRVNMVIETYEETKKVHMVLVKINKGTAAIADYEFIGIDYIKDSDLDEINKFVKGRAYDNLNDIQDAVTHITTKNVL